MGEAVVNQVNPTIYNLGKPLTRFEARVLVCALFALMPFAWLFPRTFR